SSPPPGGSGRGGGEQVSPPPHFNEGGTVQHDTHDTNPHDMLGRGAAQSGLSFDSQTRPSAMRLLVIEDDRDAADYLVKAFREVGHIADRATDGEEGRALALDGQYDVLIVDRMLPKLDGLSVIGALRAKSVETPVLILSALGQVDDRVKGLRSGGDDYLAKPYSFSELLARVEVLARRRSPGVQEETVYRVGALELDRLSHKVAREGRDIPLQPREFRLLEYLMKHAG